MKFFAAASVIVALCATVAPAFGSPPPRPYGDRQAKAGHVHGRHMATACTTNSQCEGARGKCKNNKCRTKRQDCKPSKDNWGCSAGRECVLRKTPEGIPKSWGKCVAMLTPAQVEVAYNKTDSVVIHSTGLVNMDGPGAHVGAFESGSLAFTYDEFQRACVAMCSGQAACTAVSVVDWKFPDWEVPDTSTGSYNCELLDTDVEVRGVAAAQQGPSQSNASPSERLRDIVYVKKGHDVQPFEPCDINYGYIGSSVYCAALHAINAPLPPNCQVLVGDPTDDHETLPQPDFWSKVAPSAECLASHDPTLDVVFDCLGCLIFVLSPFAPSYPNQDSAGEAVCSANDDINVIRGTCREQCYKGFEDCEADLQMASLCATGVALMKAPNHSSFGAQWNGGAINKPYVCPPADPTKSPSPTTSPSPTKSPTKSPSPTHSPTESPTKSPSPT